MRDLNIQIWRQNEWERGERETREEEKETDKQREEERMRAIIHTRMKQVEHEDG